MGCYHFHLNQLSRGKGQSAIASAAYRAGTKLECTYYGEVSDYTRKGGVVLAEIHLPKQAPERFKDRETLWNEVEWIEGNKKAQLAHSFDIALMNEFSMEENIELARRFVEEQLVARGMIADLAIHDPKKAKDKIPNPHMHIMVPIRPLQEDGTWGQKQKKVPVLTPDGQPVLNQKGQPVFRAVHTTDWSRKETLEELRSAWAKMCNELYEEKGLTERVDARSYEERGIDKIPMVHEGPNVQAMEARGISTALGSLNRLIRALNDMKERAKNLLQWSLFRESQLMERMVFLHQPTLADYLRNYYDKRNAATESYAYGTQKAKNTNLKQFAETIRFLEEKIQELDIQLNEMSQRLNQQLSALRSVNINLYAMKEYFETRPVYLELKNKYFGREKFKEEHKKELSGYYRSERILKENLDPSGKIPEGQWKREADRLSEEIAALRKEDKRIHAMLRKYEKVKNHVEVLMAEEDEEVSLPETNKREQSTETKEAVRTMRPKKKHHGMEL